jgi:hypothetical protein
VRCSRRHVTVSGRDNLRSSGAANEVRASVRLIVGGRPVEPDPGELAGCCGAQTTVLRVMREAHLLPVWQPTGSTLVVNGGGAVVSVARKSRASQKGSPPEPAA